MNVHLIDGTYELFRHYFALPSHLTTTGNEVGATRGVLASLIGMLEGGATHIGVATDHVIESFRNELWPDYKTGDDLPIDLAAQFPLLEEVLNLAGFSVWPMTTHEADDALGSAALIASRDERVETVFICTPDKDLAQCVDGNRVVQFDRRKNSVIDESGVVEKFGVPPKSIPDYLALVGDSADGFPGLPGWGARSSATLLARYGQIEQIPRDVLQWDVSVRGAKKLAETLNEQFDLALLFRRIATLDLEVPTFDAVDDLRWRGPAEGFGEIAVEIGAADMVERCERLARSR